MAAKKAAGADQHRLRAQAIAGILMLAVAAPILVAVWFVTFPFTLSAVNRRQPR